jgi:hypothetical protein
MILLYRITVVTALLAATACFDSSSRVLSDIPQEDAAIISNPSSSITSDIPLEGAVAYSHPSSIVTNDIPLDGAAAYFPVDVGNTWVYAITDRDGQPVGFDTVTVTGVEGNTVTIAGVQKNNVTFVGPGPYEHEYGVTAESIKWSWANGTTENGSPADSGDFLIRTPLSVGTQWQSLFSDFEIVAVDTTIETPAGSFDNVIVVRDNDCNGWGGALCATSYTTHTYYAKGIGLVKSMISSDKKRSLVSFSSQTSLGINEF